MQDRFKFRISVFERKSPLRDWVFEKYIEDNNNWHLTMCGDIADNACYSARYRRDNAPDSVNMVYEAQFCTGLKDKNGKLIYEGDIVKFGEFYDNEWHSFDIGKVYWGGKFDYPAFELQCSTADFDMSNGLSYIFGNGSSIEVIGNIHENKELLEV